MGRIFANIPKSAYPLLVLLLLAIGWLMRPRGAELDRRIFSRDPATIIAVDVQLDDPHPDMTIHLARDAGLWSLDGSVSDIVDQDDARALIVSICAQNRSPAVGIPDWTSRRAEYGLARPPIRLSLTPEGLDPQTLEIGGRNPSTGVFYATFSGGDDLFLVNPGLAEIAQTVIGSVRETDLWPDFEYIDIDTLAVFGGGRPAEDLFVSDSRGRWWLLPPVDGSARFGDLALDYQALYSDRLRAADGAVRLKDILIEDFLYLLSHTLVKEFLPLEQRPPASAATSGIRIASREGFNHSVLLESIRPAEDVNAWRDGSSAGMRISAKALKYMGLPLSGFLHTDAINESVNWSDSLSLAGSGSPPIMAHRLERDWRLKDAPSGDSGRTLNNVLSDLVHFLDNLKIVEARPPTSSPGFIEDTIYSLRIWRSASPTPVEEIRIGMFKADKRVGVWFPAGEGLLVVSPDALTFCREYLNMAATALR